MSQYRIKEDPETEIRCPFDDTHMIRIKRMQYHIMNCKKNFRHIQYENCTFNARHWIPKAELKHHEANCPDICIIEKDILSESKENKGTYFRGDCSVPEYRNDIMPAADEDWDAECDNNRGAFVWGDDPNDYFNPDNDREAMETRQLRLPHMIPQVLQSHKPASAEQPNASTRLGSQRLPKTLPLTQNPEAMKLGGLGRGRGYGTPQMAPQLGSSVGLGRPSGSAVPVNMMNGVVTEQVLPGPNRPGKARGRGYGNPVARNSSPSVGHSDDDASSTCSTSSMGSERSRSSASSGRGTPRQVNAPSFSGNVGTNTSFGLLGLGRGAGRARTEPQFVVPNVNHGMNGISDKTEMQNDVQVKRQIRKFEKKLQDIKVLEDMRVSGKELNSDEEAKIVSKQTILTQLQKLHVQQA